MLITEILDAYATVQRKRAAGGIYALAGFDFQLRLYLARLAEALRNGGDALGEAGQVFLEALSDIAEQQGDQLICVQAKRTLNPTKLREAAQEVVAIDGFLADRYPELRKDVRFELVGSAGDGNLAWSDLSVDAPERSTIDELLVANRLLPPRVEPDPWWRLIVALWGRLDDPYGFARFALERALSRAPVPEDARRVRDDICERYSRSRVGVALFGRALQAEDFQTTSQASPRLEIGREVTLARLRDRQYMPRPGRAHALFAKLEGRHELSRLGVDPAVHVFWLYGRSGVGKSVLLLQVLERLVREGRRVLWLAGAAEELERTLRAVADQPEHLRPEFIGVDDLYDSDARSRLDLARLGAFVDERGPAAWPLVLTCGPSEFADAFHQDAGFRGFEMHREIVLPVAADESARFAGWFRERTHQLPKPAEAFIQAQGQEGGLFVSLAVELPHGDLREFARGFAERIKLQGMEQALRLPLALNRLYLRAPYGWLASNDREKLATLNAEGDFALLEPGSEEREIRLTHPHLSDAIYRALRRPSNPLAYAHDLGEAFERALAENRLPLAARLLRLFASPREGLAGDRLADIDDAALADKCTAWARTDVASSLDPDAGADIATSWACWAATQPVVGQRLGNNLFSEAMATLQAAVHAWPDCWLRLWRRYPSADALLNWAATYLPSDAAMAHRQWSLVWEQALIADETNPSGPWHDLGKRWLEQASARPDWHYVWKRLLPARPVGNAVVVNPVVALGLRRLDGDRNGLDWAFVLQDLLKLTEGLPERALARNLISLAWQWLAGREDRPDWTYLWQAVLAHPDQLPEKVSHAEVVALGWEWLAGREDRPEWAHVW